MKSDATLIMLGHVGSVEVKPQSGSNVMNVSVAVNRYKKNPAGGEPIKLVLWVKAETWGNDEVMARLSKQITKGSYVKVEGEVWPDEYIATDKITGDKIRHKTFRLRRARILALGGERDGESRTQESAPAPAAQAAPSAAFEDVDDIPF